MNVWGLSKVRTCMAQAGVFPGRAGPVPPGAAVMLGASEETRRQSPQTPD